MIFSLVFWLGFASKVRASHLDTVSTVCGSGWVDDQHVILLMILNPKILPTRYREVVLTVSNWNEP